MATVKFNEGTKFETSLDLEDKETVIYTKPPKNLMMRSLDNPLKYWIIMFVITNKRVVTIPLPKYKNKRQVESFYFKDISSVVEKQQISKEHEGTWSGFTINMKDGGKSSYEKGGSHLTVRMEMNFINLVRNFIQEIIMSNAKDPNAGIGLAMMEASAKTDASRAYAEATGASSYTEYGPNTAKMQQAAKDRAAKIDFSKADHKKIREFIIDMINSFVAIENG